MVILMWIIIFFILVRSAVALSNLISLPKLDMTNKRYEDKVSILIPARNEERNILFLLESILSQDYENYEVIILDDDSSDNTFEICNNFALSHTAFKVIKGKPLPNDWLGKNFACHQLAREASGKYLLFLDADVKMVSGLLNSALHQMITNKLALLSLFPDQQMSTIGEKAVIPLMNYLLLTLLPIRLIYGNSNPVFAAACGQFMLFDQEGYRKNQWHFKVRSEVVEDLKIMKTIKLAGYRGEALLANGLIHCRMYTGYMEAIDGFSKNFLAPFNNSILLFLVFLLFQIAGPILILSTLNVELILLMCVFIFLTRWMTSKLSRQNIAYNTVLHPLQMANLVIIGYFAIRKNLTKTTQWKGRYVG
jgi:glycosyltransferase involved in cell wall biosynthesis